MIVIDFREPIAPFVAGQPFHQSLEQMRSGHILLASWNPRLLPQPSRWCSLANGHHRLDGRVLLERAVSTGFLRRTGLAEGTPSRVADIMNMEPTPSDREILAGLVERVTYQNADNGFCVLRVKARGHRDLVTLVGHAGTISAGEWITATGDWVNDRTHGQQFKARFLKTSTPTSNEGIEKYLASGQHVVAAGGAMGSACAAAKLRIPERHHLEGVRQLYRARLRIRL